MQEPSDTHDLSGAADTSAAGDQPGADSWWIAALGDMLVWARLRVRASGVAEVFDCDGKTLVYDGDDSARAALMDADFAAWDGLDEDDAARMGMTLAELSPPSGRSDTALRAQMMVRLPERH